MVANCVAYGCTNVYSKNPNVQFHRFPFKRPEILKLWITAVRRKDWEPACTSRLCSQHFKENDYQIRPGGSTRLLKMDAVPSVFNFPKHLQKPAQSRRVLTYKHENKIDAPFQDVENMEVVHVQLQKHAETQTCSSGEAKVNLMRRKIKTLKQKVRRRDIKINSMQALIQELKKNQCTTDNLTVILENYFQGLPLELVVHQFNHQNTAPGRRRYTETMKQFAHTLYFYSPKAYSFVRQHFVLPNPRTIRKWLSSVNCYPGFLGEVMEFLKMEVIEQPCLSNCALIIDAMSIRKQIIWDNVKGKFVGNEDFGGVININKESPATEALFFQIVSYTNKYKCPVGYFLTDKADANVQKQLITCCLRNLYEIGIVIRSITSDGTATNIKTYKNLGCNVDFVENDSSLAFQSYFYHPCSSNVRVHCIMDACHLIKLARNCMAEKSLMSESGHINWDFVKRLHNIQTDEQLRLANSLSSSHIYYRNKIMNVKLAAQTLSSSVANALAYLEKEGYENFQGCTATVEYINTLDKIFDMLNARNPFGKGYKSPISPKSLIYIKQTFSSATTYLKSLKLDGVPLLRHARKTFAWGFIITFSSITELAQDLFNLEVNPLNYFLPYKCSQDHLELYFSCIRSRGGWNNNPNVLQLRWALRQLLFKNSVKSSHTANCVNFDATSDIAAFEFTNQNTSIIQEDENDESFDYTLFNLINYSLSDYKENVLYYISGFVAKKVAKNTGCIDCVNILFYCEKNIYRDHTYNKTANKTFKKFTNFITNGGLLFAADIVFRIIQFVEMYYQHLIKTVSLKDTNFRHLLQNAAKHKFSACLHQFQPTHPVGGEEFLSDLHELQLLKRIVNEYLKCRMPHHAKLINEKSHGKDTGLRQKYTKLILFHNL